jgi:hypothetical protein
VYDLEFQVGTETEIEDGLGSLCSRTFVHVLFPFVLFCFDLICFVLYCFSLHSLSGAAPPIRRDSTSLI